MIVMPANSSGWFFHCLARETGRIGHLYSPRQNRGPWPWFPYALDNGAFTCWNMATNTFDFEKWKTLEGAWWQLIFWAQSTGQPPLWAIVPDVPGQKDATLKQWAHYAPGLKSFRIPLAIAVQDGMTPDDVLCLYPHADVVCVGGTTEWKWQTAEMWCKNFARVHVLRCNSPDRIYDLEKWGCESTDGTGWNRGDRKQTAGLEAWARSKALPVDDPLWPHVSRARCQKQLTFA